MTERMNRDFERVMSDVGNTPQFEAPILADLMQRIVHRPWWSMKDPLPVDPETWQKANNEMREVQERQGRRVMAAEWAPLPNFLLMGVPVVMHG
jgi:hypothetical protein